MMLFSMLTAAQGGKSIAFLSRTFGLSDRQMTNVIRHYLPIFTKGIQKNFAQQGGLASLLKTLDHGNYSSYYDDPDIYTNPQARHNGLMIMERSLGPINVQKQILHRIYQSTGIDPDTLQLILPFVTILALSALYRKANGNMLPQNTSNAIGYQPTSNGQSYQYQQKPQQTPATSQQDEMHHEIHKHLMAQTQQQQVHQSVPQQVPTFTDHPQHRNVSPNNHQYANQNMPSEQHIPTQQRQHGSEERLPNIILQAQEAHAKKQKQQNGKSRLRNLLKASKKKTDTEPVQNLQMQQPQTIHQQNPAQMQQAQFQQQQQQLHHQAHQFVQQQTPQYQQHSAPQYSQQAPQMPVPRRQTRKYVSLQEKLLNELPWYNQAQ